MTYEEKRIDIPHKLTLDGRGQLTVTGVVDVEQFDEQQAVLETSRGLLMIRGRGLHLQMLSLDGGQIEVEGTVDALVYEDEAPTGGWFGRLFR